MSVIGVCGLQLGTNHILRLVCSKPNSAFEHAEYFNAYELRHTNDRLPGSGNNRSREARAVLNKDKVRRVLTIYCHRTHLV